MATVQMPSAKYPSAQAGQALIGGPWGRDPRPAQRPLFEGLLP
jgi:hypothetical protein